MAMKENSKKVLEYLKEVHGADVTANDIAEACGLTTKQVNGIVTAALQRKEYAVRIPAEIQLEDGTHKAVKFIKLTDAGLNLDPDADEEKAADAEYAE